MELQDAIKNRRSIRKFLSIPVEWSKICAMLDAARLAPSAGNVQDWRFIVVTERDRISKLADAALGQKFIEQAPVVIVVCSDLDYINKHYGERGEELYSIQNCAAAIQNMFLTATELGLGTCWVGAFDENAVNRILTIPETVKPMAILPIGYPDEKPRAPHRYPSTDVVYFEKYGNQIRDRSAVLGLFGKSVEKSVKKTIASAKEKAKVVVKKLKKKFSK